MAEVYGDAWQIDFITASQTCHGKCHVLTVMEETAGWARNVSCVPCHHMGTILGLEKQVLGQHGTPERIESNNKPQNHFIDTWAKERGIEWV